MAIATTVTATIICCESMRSGSRRQNIAMVIQTAYDMVSPERDSPVAAGDKAGGARSVNCEATARPHASALTARPASRCVPARRSRRSSEGRDRFFRFRGVAGARIKSLSFMGVQQRRGRNDNLRMAQWTSLGRLLHQVVVLNHPMSLSQEHGIYD